MILLNRLLKYSNLLDCFLANEIDFSIWHVLLINQFRLEQKFLMKINCLYSLE